MKTAGWRGKTKADVPQWVLEARKAKAISKTSYSNGGLPRRRPNAPISLPRLRCQDDPK